MSLFLPRMKNISVCAGCCSPIQDQYILRVAPDLEWHAKCLKCADCLQFLDETCTCFVRDSKTFCRVCYVRLFSIKCGRCGEVFKKNDFVMRARHAIYHTDCFRCVACDRKLVPGDEFALKEEEGLLCKMDFEISEHLFDEVDSNGCSDARGGGKAGGGGLSADDELHMAEDAQPLNVAKGRSADPAGSPFGPPPAGKPAPAAGPGGGGAAPPASFKREGRGSKSDGKATRVRTVLTEKQLHTLRTCYSANPRPDALMKEQLVEMTGLNSRVIRVWFQNKRCKDKKRSIIMKQMHQQEKGSQESHRLSLSGVHAVPLVASSPVSHEMTGLQPIEIQTYQPPWKSLSEFALQHDLERLESNAPHFRHLVRQIHGYGTGDLMRPMGGELHPGYEGLHVGPPSNHSSHFPSTPSELSSSSSE